VPDHLDVAVAVAATALHLNTGDHLLELLLPLVLTVALRADVDLTSVEEPDDAELGGAQVHRVAQCGCVHSGGGSAYSFQTPRTTGGLFIATDDDDATGSAAAAAQKRQSSSTGEIPNQSLSSGRYSARLVNGSTQLPALLHACQSCR